METRTRSSVGVSIGCYARVTSILVLLLPAPSLASRVDVLFWQGASQFVPPDQILSGANGDKQGADSGTATWDVVISGYSRTWTSGEMRQADVFLSFGNEGIAATSISIEFDTEGRDILDIVAIREYNANVGTVAVSGPDDCAPFNACGSQYVTQAAGLTRAGKFSSTESVDGSGGSIQRIGHLAPVAIAGPAAIDGSHVGTVRVASVVFKRTENEGATRIRSFLATGDGFTRNDPVYESTVQSFGSWISSRDLIPALPRIGLLALASLLLGAGVHRLQRRRSALTPTDD